MLVAISALSVVLVHEARKDSAKVVHTVEVENQLSTLLLQIRRAESSARGYLLTSEPRFLTEHEAATATILPDVDKLTRLTSDNPVQAENARQLRAAGRSPACRICQGHRIRQTQRSRRRHRDAA